MSEEDKGAEAGSEKTGADKETEKTNSEATKKTDNQGSDDANSELLKLKKEISDRDKKISEYAKGEKERQAALLSSKTAEEKLAIYESENKQLKQKDAFSNAFKGSDLNPDEWSPVLNKADDPIAQAEALSSLLSKREAAAAAKAVEPFKTSKLGDVDKGTDTSNNQTNDDAFTRGLKKGAS